jgi:hypothetical protein
MHEPGAGRPHRQTVRLRPYRAADLPAVRRICADSGFLGQPMPVTPRHTPHFHINVLPRARSVRGTRALIHSFVDFLRARGHRQVCGQMVTYSSRRGEGLFKRYGFKVVDRVEVTKYRALHRAPVLLSTLLKELRAVTDSGEQPTWRAPPHS